MDCMSSNTISFILNGQKIEYNSDVVTYIELRKKYNALFKEHITNFFNKYKDAESAEEVISLTANYGVEEVAAVYLGFADYFLERGIYDFSADYMEYKNGREYIFRPMIDEIKSIKKQLDDINEREEYERRRREYRKESRGRFSSFGFGISGAITGALKAGALNIGTGLVHSAYNAVGNAVTSMNASSERGSVFSESRDSVINAVVESMNRVLPTVVDQLDLDTGFDFPKSKVIIQNIDKGIIKNEPVLGKACLDGIKCDPFNKNYYVYFIKNLENDKTIREMADFFCVDISDYVKMLHELYGVHFENPRQIGVVNTILVDVKRDIVAKFCIDEDFLEKDYFKNSDNPEMIGYIIEYLENNVKVSESDIEAKRFFEIKIEELKKTRLAVRKAVLKKKKLEAEQKAKAEQAAREKQSEKERRTQIIQYFPRHIIAQLVCYAYADEACKGVYCANQIPSDLLETAYDAYGEQGDLADSDVLLLYDDSWSGDASSGILMNSTEIISSRNNKIQLKDIINVKHDVSESSIILDTVNDKDYEFFNIYVEEEYQKVMLVLSAICNPVDAEEKVWKWIDAYYAEHYETLTGYTSETQATEVQSTVETQIVEAPVNKGGPIKQVQVSCQDGIYTIDGSLSNRIDQICSIKNMPNFGELNFGKNVIRDKARKACETYLKDYGVYPDEVWFQYDMGGNGSRGLTISKTYLLNSNGQGFAIEDVQSVQLTAEGYMYVVSKDGSGYYLCEGINILPGTLDTINLIFSVMFYDQPAGLKL